jgi:dihydroorotate dehydrogenase
MTHPFTVGGIPMQLPIMMGGGVCKFVHQLDPYLRPDLPVGALELGSITPACREGNLESPQWPETSEEFQQYGFGLNAWSMPNAGFEDSLTRLAGILSPHPLVVNVAGEKPAHFVLGPISLSKSAPSCSRTPCT